MPQGRRGFFRSLIGSGALLGVFGGKAAAEDNNPPVDGRYDILVAGGGPGGVCAAVAAARAGKKVLLVERYGFLGGMATAGLVEPFMPYSTLGIQVNAGLFEEVRQRLIRAGGYGSPVDQDCTDSEVLKMVELDLLLDSGADVLFHSFVYGVTIRKNRVTEVKVANKAGEMRFAADYFVDATGDGDLAFFAGADWELGREEDGFTQPSTMFFKMSGVDQDKMLKTMRKNKWDHNFTELTEKARAAGDFTSPREDTLWFSTPRYGVIAFNTTRLIKYDATNPWNQTEMEIKGLAQVRDTARYAVKYLPGFEKAYLSQVASQVGVRESRRIVCDYKLTQDDLVSCREFEDSLARGCYPIDIHNPVGSGTVHMGIPDGKSYGIPYRSMTVKGFDNLLMGCRAIWGTHEAHSAYRVQPIVMCIGHAAGVAAAEAHSGRSCLRGIDITKVREDLKKQGAVV